MPRPKKAESATLDLREACVVAAREVIAERGLEHLSLREVSRRLGVSHQAPYKHYPSRDHLLAEVMRRCFQHFVAHLDARPRIDNPDEDLASLGRQYLAFAEQHPLEYRLMFSTTWPESARDAGLEADATHAFDMLCAVLRRRHGEGPAQRDRVLLDALTLWATVHGLAGVMSGHQLDKLGLTPRLLQQVVPHALGRLGAGMTG